MKFAPLRLYAVATVWLLFISVLSAVSLKVAPANRLS